jgi:CRISPR-associated protein Cas2
MFVLVTYDVSTGTKAGARRLRRVARACKDYGQRVQKSVFECRVERKDWIVFRDRLLSEIDESQDSLRFYFLDAGVTAEHHGIKEPVDLEAPLIL